MKTSLSVALVTRNRPESLRRGLASLRAQSVQPMEVIVADDSDAAVADATRGVAQRFACRYVAGPRRGLYANRNAAALACRGSHIRTMDDDHTWPAGHLAQCLAAIEAEPSAIWTTGEIGYVEGRLVGRADTAGQLHPSGVAGPVHDPDHNWAIADGSTTYPRAIFDRGFRMLETFGYGSSYLEFGAFLYHHGWHSRCVSRACIEHFAEPLTLNRGRDLEVMKSRLYASISFNLYFRRNPLLFSKYLFRYLVWSRQLKLWGELSGILRLARFRWS